MCYDAKTSLTTYLISSILSTFLFLTGDKYDKTIAISGLGDVPDSIIVNYIIEDNIKSIKIGHQSEIFHYTFSNIQSNIIWWSNVFSTSFFSPWDNIESPIDTIKVIKKPIISDLTFEL